LWIHLWENAELLKTIEKRICVFEPSYQRTEKEHGGSFAAPKQRFSMVQFNLKALSGSSGYKFVNIWMKTQHLGLLDSSRANVMSEDYVNNPKIECSVVDGKYAFKPKYNLKDKKALLRLLDQHDQRGLGGILLEDIEEGLPNSRKLSRRKFFSSMIRAVSFSVDEEFQKLWRSVTVDSMDEEKIEEYLKRQGISSMQDSRPKKVAPIQRRKKPASQKKRRFKTHNEHLAGVLKDYSDITPGK
uniref:Transcription initiation factor IIE subunit beta n=1 Tax=Capra hircus TaxID=9925 RepID=A0A452DLG7_CAPHI